MAETVKVLQFKNLTLADIIKYMILKNIYMTLEGADASEEPQVHTFLASQDACLWGLDSLGGSDTSYLKTCGC